MLPFFFSRNQNNFPLKTLYYCTNSVKLSHILRIFRGRNLIIITKKFYSSELESDEAMNQFYEKNKSKFITEYAMTNPEEDIAESFMRFIVDEKPKGDTMAEEKIRFFYQFDELVELRKEMREKL